MLAKIGDYDLHGAPFSWTAVVAMRDALTKYPDCKYVWFLDASGFIMNPKLRIEDYIMAPARLDELMKKDYPVVPPDSIIKTFSHLKGKDVDVVLTQDKDGLSSASYIVRNGEWARFFLETWYDPLYRSYNFQKAETHALVSLPLTPVPTHRFLLTYPLSTGTHRPMAPDHPLAHGNRRPEPAQLVHQGLKGGRVQGRRPGGAVP